MAFNDMYTCPRGEIRNPRTGRCVMTKRPLGAALNAAVQALKKGQAWPECPSSNGVHDFASGQCVTNTSRVGSLRSLKAAWSLVNKSNSAHAKLLTSRAFAAAVASNDKRQHRNLQARYEARGRDLKDAGNMFDRLAQHVTALQAEKNRNASNAANLRRRLANSNNTAEDKVQLHGMLMQAVAARDTCHKDLTTLRGLYANAQKAILAGS